MFVPNIVVLGPEDYSLGSEHLPGIFLLSFQNLSLNEWQKDWDSGDTGRAIFNILPKITLTPASWSREPILFSTGHCPFPSYLYRFRLYHSDICTCGEKGDPLHYATSCHMTLFYHFTKPSAEYTQLWWKSLLSNKPSRINIAKLISFLTENENLMKQPPDATSLSDSDPDFYPSPDLRLILAFNFRTSQIEQAFLRMRCLKRREPEMIDGKVNSPLA
ncbi:hypothetical protein AVEN_216328-1 [Araneus ventricosus]|uniref:Uncharacterized protein n=1 Tax=Araneus ventricosus TaxID=182803 RepID=A0A4Y2MNH6_ARAVE|nr:hypothetical protein AVEN_216328-1 [Araneus ventricosus]